MAMLITGVADEFTWAYMFVALVPFAFFFKMQKRERAWIISLTAMYLCTGVLLIMLLNPTLDRASADLIRVFLTSSHLIVACLIGYGLGLTAAFMATNYPRFRWWGMIGGAIGVLLALYCLWDATGKNYFGRAGWPDFWASFGQWPHWVVRAFAKNQFGLPVFANLLLVALALAFVCALLIYRRRGPLLITLALFTLMPAYSVLDHWFDSEQRNHWFGYWFGHDMFTPPFNGKDAKSIYPQMTKDAILFGGTDPGRFCPEYMIYCESFTPHNCQPAQDQKYDRRDVYIITQNALADGTYLNFIRSHYYRSTQIDPPFFSELARTFLKDNQYQTNLLAQAVRPLDRFFTALGTRVEKRRRTYTSWFTERDFTDLPALAVKLHAQQDPLSKYIYEHCAAQTQQLLSGKADNPELGRSLANDLNQLMDRDLQIKEQLAAKQQAKEDVDLKITDGDSSERLRGKQQQLAKEIAELSKVQPLYEPDRFKQVAISEYLADFIKENPQSHTRIRLNRLLLEAAYPKEIAKSIGGVYPDREIYTPTPDDSQQCFSEYLADAQRRYQLNQLKPGEDVKVIDNKVQVSGQVAVMAINGLLTKVIFDHNPKNEFFVEESMALDWMYPYLTPFGVIMKINRQPLPEITEDIIRRDHEFWSQYSARLIGNWITYDTPIKDVCAWIEKTYLRRDFNGFTGDRKFIRDEDAQKAFSKLRNSIGGIYAWRVNDPNNRNPQVQQRMIKEADFTFCQAFAFCPFNTESVFRYINLLTSLRRFDDALMVASTCLKLDPYNGQVLELVNRLQTWKSESGAANQAAPRLEQLQAAVRQNPANFQAAFDLAGLYMQMQQSGQALEILDGILNHPQADASVLRTLLLAYSSINNAAKLQATVEKLEALVRANPANFNAVIGLAEGYRHLQKNDAAIQALDTALNNPKVDRNTIMQLAEQYAEMANYPKLEITLEKLVKLSPDAPEAWYDLAALKAAVGKAPESFDALRHAFDLSDQRLRTNPKASNLVAMAQTDQRFTTLRQTPEFKQLSNRK
jgi:tetratricopeptide (TPR) repeat protein